MLVGRLPFDILEEICKLIALQKTEPPSTQTHINNPSRFERIFDLRRKNETSPYAVRLVCKQLNEILVKYLFRDVHLRLGWDWLHINPPLKALVGLEGNPSAQVILDNARLLRIGALFRQGRSQFLDDDHRDHERNLSLPPDVYYHYPYPKAKKQKHQEFEAMIQDAKTYLSAAIAAMSHVEEVRWEILEKECPEWYFAAVVSGLSTLKNVVGFHLKRPYQRYQAGITAPTAPFFREMLPVICGMKHLKELDLSFVECNPPDFDAFWTSLRGSSVKLESISSDGISMSFLEYAASYSGIRILRCTHRSQMTQRSMSESLQNPVQVASFMFNTVLPRHSDTLEFLQLPSLNDEEKVWFVGPKNIEVLSACKSLRTLETKFCINSHEDMMPNLISLMNYIRLVPSLQRLRLNILDYSQLEIGPYGTRRYPPRINMANDLLIRYDPDSADGLPPSLGILAYPIQESVDYQLKSTPEGLRYQTNHEFKAFTPGVTSEIRRGVCFPMGTANEVSGVYYVDRELIKAERQKYAADQAAAMRPIEALHLSK